MAANANLDRWWKKNCPPSLKEGAAASAIAEFIKREGSLNNSMDVARYFKSVGGLKAAIAKDQSQAKKSKDKQAVKFLAEAEKRVHAASKSTAGHLTPKSGLSCDFATTSGVRAKDAGKSPPDDAVVNQADSRWSLIRDGKALSAAKSKSCQAVPKRVSVRELADWRSEKTTWVCTLKNQENAAIVTLKFELNYQWNGQQKTTNGLYLNNCKLWVTEAKVDWGYSVNADVDVGRPFNSGSKSVPVGAVRLKLSVAISTPLDRINKTWTITCHGDKRREIK